MARSEIAATSIDEALRIGAAALSNSETPMLDARVLMKHALGVDDAALIARSRDEMPGAVAEIFADLIARRHKNEPIAYITGIQEFWGLAFEVDRRVLIPRPDSECLIDAVLARRPREQRYKILDLGTGSGCLLCALLSEYENADGLGVDMSEPALELATKNAHGLGLGARAQFIASDWLSAVDGDWDIIIANPPYISDTDMRVLPKGVADFEPARALGGGVDGLDPYREIMPQLTAALNDRSLVIFETGKDQTEKLSTIIAKWLPKATREVIFDLEGRPRAVLAEMQLPE